MTTLREPPVPHAVLDAYALGDAALTPITIGLINQTFRVERGGVPIAVLQRLHPIFGAAVNEDLDRLTERVAAAGMTTPRLIRTQTGARYVEHAGQVFRALSYLEGRTLTEVGSPRISRAAGALAGRFLRALEGAPYEFRFTRAGVHDFPRHLRALEEALTTHAAHPEIAESRPIAEWILEHARTLPALPATRARIVHGDLKITNLLFEPARDEGLAVLDLDTMAHGTIPVELGDALRSWCNPAGESRAGGIDPELFRAALQGFRASGPALDPEERGAIVLGVETIATELASRFARDALEDSYFGWDPSRYPSRRAHCRARASSQLVLARSIREHRAELERIAEDA